MTSQPPEKILHLHFGKEGGAERFFVNLVQGLDQHGFEQRFVIRPDRLWHDEVAALGPVIENNYRRLSPMSYVLTWQVRRLVKKWKPDVIMAWMSRSSRLIPNEPSALKLTRLGDYPRHLEHFRYNDGIVSNVPGIAERCTELGWDRPLHLISNFPREVVPVAVNRADLSTPDDAFLVVGTGRFVRRKGFDTLVRAVAKNPKAWLWLAGDGPEEDKLRALVAELGMAERTRFLGWVDEPMHYVAAGDAYVMPSRHEPLGNVILESWLAKVPVVTTHSEGPTWFVADKEDALMVDIDDVDAMFDALTRIEKEPKLAQHLVERGTQKLNDQFTKERILEQYIELFNSKPSG